MAALLGRLHFYIGLFVGPFLLVAALSGVLYALTPQIENRLYDHALHTDSEGQALTLAEQVRRAQALVGSELAVAAVRPAPAPGQTTRVMFSVPGLGASEHRAVFVDPVSGEIRGDLPVYGTSGVLPLRTWIDQFHRGLMLGDVGRLYSELAASWLWVAALGGLWMWWQRRPRAGVRRWHATAGLWLSAGLLFFSATGLTWSQYAGDNIGVLRAHYGWSTPSVKTALGSHAAIPAGEHAHHLNALGPDAAAVTATSTVMPMEMPMNMPMDEHAEHHAGAPAPAQAAGAVDPSMFDQVLAVARASDITAAKLEIRPATGPAKAWVVNEIDRGWPTQVDAVSIDPRTMTVVDHARFTQYSLPAKLTRWGIDAHMGVLFGLANQIVLVLVAGGLAAMVVLGYVMWWRRRPALRRDTRLVDAWRACSVPAQVLSLVVAVLLGLALPLLGASLALLVVLDLLIGLRSTAAQVPVVD